MELNLTVKVKDKPYGVGIAIGGTSDSKWGASGEGGAGGDIGNTSEKSNLRGKARVKAFGNWINSVSGKVYVASGDGKGIGYDGTVRSDVGAGVAGEVKKEVVATKKGLLGIGCKIRGCLDREGHAKIGGNVHSYTPEELKEEVGAGSGGGRRIKFGLKKTNKKIDENSSNEAIEEKQGEEEKLGEENKADTSVDRENSEGCKPEASVIEADNKQDVSEKDVLKHAEKDAPKEEHVDENVPKLIVVKENADNKTSDVHIVNKLGNKDASDESNVKEQSGKVVSEKNTDIIVSGQ